MWKYIKKYLGFMIAAGFAMVMEVMVDLIQPTIMSNIVDEGVLGIHNSGVGDLNIAMRKDCFSRIMSMSFPQVDRFGTGSLITRVTNDMTQIRNMIETMVRGLIRTSFFFGGSIFFMFRLYPRFGLIALCALPFIAGVMLLCLTKAAPGFARMQEQLDTVNAIMQEDVAGIRIIKACVREIYEKLRFGRANDELIGTQLHVLIIFAFMTPAMNLLMYVVVILIILIGAHPAGGGFAQPGAIMGAITYTTQLLNSILGLVMLFQNISRGNASWKRVRQILRTDPDLKDGGFEGDAELRGQVEFRNVAFTYPGAAHPVLNNINLTVYPGETLAIMGATGCGKTTLVNLIPRFYDVSAGSVLVDGVDVRDYNQKSLRARVAVALQKAELFGLSVSDNIRWGKLTCDDSEIRKAAQTAQADGFISEMPEGYDEMIAERGMSLSGGQRQRMSIARTVLKDAEIFIFDDSTSALDLKTEAAFYEALKGSHPDSTKIIVAQRIASIRQADRIALLENGEIAACGTHEELMQTCDIYQKIYNSQIGEEVSDGR